MTKRELIYVILNQKNIYDARNLFRENYNTLKDCNFIFYTNHLLQESPFITCDIENVFCNKLNNKKILL